MPPRRPPRKPPRAGPPVAAGSGPGRKRRRYTLSEAAREQRRLAAKRPRRSTPRSRAQRRVAARTHGRYAAAPLRQLLPACNRRQCPMRDADGNPAFPCALKQAVDDQAARTAEAAPSLGPLAASAIENCPIPLQTNPELRERFVAAIRDGKVEGLAEISGSFLAATSELAAQELARLKAEGFSIDVPIINPETGTPFVDAEGNPITIARKNPRGEHTLKALEMVGATAAQQAITPKSRAEKGRDEGIQSALEHAADMRRRFGVAP